MAENKFGNRGRAFNNAPWIFERVGSGSRRSSPSMDRRDLERIPTDQEWIGFLEGKNPTYPEKAMAADSEHLRKRMELMRTDPTSPDTRLADYLLGIVPATTDTLVELMLGGYFAAAASGCCIAGYAILIRYSDAPVCPKTLQPWWRS